MFRPFFVFMKETPYKNFVQTVAQMKLICYINNCKFHEALSWRSNYF